LTEFDLRALLESLHEKGVRFVVIGGVAVAAHGYVRGTEDLDLVPDPDPENLKHLAEALSALDSTLPTARNRRFDPASDAGVIRRGGTSPLTLGLAASTFCAARARSPQLHPARWGRRGE